MIREAGFLAVWLMAACGGSSSHATEPAPAPEAEPATEAQQVQAIADAVNAEAEAATGCWNKASAGHPGVDGRVVLEIEIGQQGKTAAAKIVSDEIGNQVLRACLLTTWRAHQWPPVLSPGTVIQLPPYVFVAPEPPAPDEVGAP